MDNQLYLNRFWDALPEILLAIVILIVGFIVAKVLERVVYKMLQKFKLDEKVGSKQEKYSVSKIISKVVFILIIIFTLMLFFNVLNLGAIATPFAGMFDQLSGAFISLLKAGLILLVAWVLASVAKRLILMVGRKADLKKIANKAKAPEANTTKWLETAANIAFYLVLLLFLPAVLSALNIEGLSEPISNMLASFLNFIPKLIGAALIFAIGWLAATIVRKILSSFLASAGVDRLAERFHLSSFFEGTSLSKVIGLIAFVLILLPVSITALEVLDLDGISGPAIAMLNSILVMLPNIAIAILLVLVGLIVGRWVKSVVSKIAQNLGADSLFGKMGFDKKPATADTEQSVSGIIGTIAQVVIVLLFVAEALQVVGLAFMVGLVSGIFAYLPAVLAALVILAVGFWLANLAENFVGNVFKDSSGSPHLLRYVAKYAILAFAFFMALDMLGIAASIIQSAFILILGGLALAFGLAFGLGGKEHASRYLDRAEKSLEKAEVDQEAWKETKMEEEAKDVGLKKEDRAAIDPVVEKRSPDEEFPFRDEDPFKNE